MDQVYPLFMTFGTSDSTSAYYRLAIPTLGAYGQWIIRKVPDDGWGVQLLMLIIQIQLELELPYIKGVPYTFTSLGLERTSIGR